MRILKILKRFKRNPMLLFVNLPGLAIGLAAFLLLMVYVFHETSYDLHFANKNRVVRLYNTITEESSVETYPICARKAYTEIPLKIPEIEKACQIYRGWQTTVSKGESQYRIENLLYVDPEFFEVFGLDLLEGEKGEVLSQKNQLVLTESLARKIFGKDPCIGEMVVMEGEDYSVVGIISDLPKTTHFQFDVLTSMQTINPDLYMGGLEFFTYYLLAENSNVEVVGRKIRPLNNEIVSDIFNADNVKISSGIEPLTRLHLHTKADFDLSPKGSMGEIALIASLAALILLIAIINFINLYIFQGEKRLLEIGMRKSFGASRSRLRQLFYLETALLCLLAFGLAFLLARAGLSYFSHLMRVDLSFDEITSPYSIAAMMIFLAGLVFVAGSYPAHYLAKLPVIDAIRGGVKTLTRKKWLSVLSVMVQFFISIFLIVSLLVLNAQISYMKNIPLGFSADQVIGITHFNTRLGPKAVAIKQELKKLTFVQNIGTSGHYMGGGVSGQGLYKYGESEETSRSINQYRVQPGFCETMQLQLVDGRFFEDTPEDESGMILNEAAVKMLGLENPVGQLFIMNDEEPLKIIGVVKDFYYNENAGKLIQPLCLTAYSNDVNVFYLKIQGDFSKEKRESVARIFNDFLPDYQFSSFTLQNLFKHKYAEEERFFSLVLSGTLLAIFLSFIGMFALSVYNVERRTKEIGVKKVHGSTSAQVVIKLLSDILIWVIIAMIPAFLVAYIAMRQILTNFANKIELSPLYFLFGGVIALIIATLAISFKSISAANQNPVDSLRDE
ncbi:MAG: ABC transporter permease [Bacteroidales bacterium]|nr:ABC transporter permease [Bacteroidales bacterium]